MFPVILETSDDTEACLWMMEMHQNDGFASRLGSKPCFNGTSKSSDFK